MAANQLVAQRLHEISQMMELLGLDSFRASSHARAARTVEDLAQDIGELAKDRKALLEVPGIGQKMADKIIEFCTTGQMKEHTDLMKEVPSGLLTLLKVPGLGPKTVRAMWQEIGITDVAGLKKAIADGSVLKVPRMGEKAVEKIKAALVFAEQTQDRLWLGRAADVAAVFVERLKGVKGVARVEPAGSLRRGKETIGDIDVLVALKKGSEDQMGAVAEVFRTTPGVAEVLVAGDTKSSVRYTLGFDIGRWKKDGDEQKGGPSVQVDLRVLPLSSWGAALMYFTGSKEHNIRLRERAQKMGLTLNDWGLFQDDGKPAPHTRGLKSLAGATEEEVYEKLGVVWVPPEMREDRGELDIKEPVRLVELADIKAELHSHTTASDGAMTIEELATRAKDRGFHTIAVTDHSRSSAVAGGLSIERLLEHIDAVHAAGAKTKGITILAGSEVDILADGSLDYPDDILKKLDVVVASPHTALSQDPPTATARLIKAIENPWVHIIGHPTGRLINRRPGLSPDMAAIIKAASINEVALEVNSHWMRLDLRDIHVRQAVAAECKIAIDCDVHAPEDYDCLRFGVATARRGWLTPELCLNTWPAKKLHAWLKSKR